MPIWIRKQISEQTELAIWRIEETLTDLQNKVTLSPADEKLFGSFKIEQRQKQWLAYRLLIRALLGNKSATVDYDEYGKPHLSLKDHQISIAHTADYATVIISREGRTGIDIEQLRPRIIKVREKFLSPQELSYAQGSSELEKLTVYWGAKEALVKLYGRRHLDFIKSFKLSDFGFSGKGNFTGKAIVEGVSRTYQINYEMIDKLILVYVVEN